MVINLWGLDKYDSKHTGIRKMYEKTRTDGHTGKQEKEIYDNYKFE